MEDFRLEAIQKSSSIRLNAMSSDSANKFTIPALKPKASSSGSKLKDGSSITLGGTSSNINQFLLKQLEQQCNNGLPNTDRFNVPKLEKASTSSFIIPELKSTNPLKAPVVKAVTTSSLLDVQELKGQQDKELETANPQTEDHIIDLTTALSSTRIGSNTSIIGANQRKKLQSKVFEIPFIDCDRQPQLPQTDNYCLIDISHSQFQYNLAQPSALGRILSSKTKRNQISELPAQKAEFKAKHRIERFTFDTKSPDDLVLDSLNRFTRAQ